MDSKKYKILIVEDDIDERRIYQEVFKSSNFDIDLATNGEEGLEKVRGGGYSVILLDIMMPKVDGITFLTELQNNPPQKENGPVFLLTNLSNNELIQKALNLGAKECLLKTDYTPSQLVEKVKKSLHLI